MSEYTVRYIHKISPSPNDVGPGIWLNASDLQSKTSLAKALRERRVLESGRALQEYRIEADGKIVAFPSNRGGRSIWHSIILTPVSSQQKQDPMSKSSKSKKSGAKKMGKKSGAKKTIQGFLRDDQGLLQRVTLQQVGGKLYDSYNEHAYYNQPLTETSETTELRGWGRSSGSARVWRGETEMGRQYEILVPIRHSQRFAKKASKKSSKKSGAKKSGAKGGGKKTEKVCLMKGYAYELDPDGGSWDKAKDDYWDMVLIDGGPATVLGKRRVDGSECVVAKRGGKIYAQTAIHVTKC